MTSEVTSTVDKNTVQATGHVAAPPEEVFEYLRRPSNHMALNGDHSVRGALAGPPVLGPGDKFGMRMRIGLPYRVVNKVIEFEPGQRIAWCHFAGHTWRWELRPEGDGTRVTETFDQSTARAPLPFFFRLTGYPKRHRDNLVKSVTNLAEHFAVSEGNDAGDNPEKA
jgi:uncharacterized protein YndB with AHSA1/START domain